MNLDAALRENGGKGPGFHFARHALSVVILLHHASVLTVGAERAPAATKGDAMASLSMLLQGGDARVPAPVDHRAAAAVPVLAGRRLLRAERLSRRRQRLSHARHAPVPELSRLAHRRRRSPRRCCCRRSCSARSSPASRSAPISAMRNFYRYFGNIFGFVTYELPGVFTDNPVPALVNGNLWTLPPEFYCYLVLSALMASGAAVHSARGFSRRAPRRSPSAVAALYGDLRLVRADAASTRRALPAGSSSISSSSAWRCGSMPSMCGSIGRLFVLFGGLYVAADGDEDERFSRRPLPRLLRRLCRE